MRQVSDAGNYSFYCQMPMLFLSFFLKQHILEFPYMFIQERTFFISDSDKHKTDSIVKDKDNLAMLLVLLGHGLGDD